MNTSKYCAHLGKIPSIKDTHLWVNSGRDDVSVSRLLCGMLITPQILCRFKLITNDMCGVCRVVDSMEHIIRYRSVTPQTLFGHTQNSHKVVLPTSIGWELLCVCPKINCDVITSVAYSGL